MPGHSSKTNQSKKTSVASANERSKKSLSPEFSDERAAVHSQNGLTQVANDSPQVKQLQAFQEMAANSEQQQKANYFQELANGDAPIVQRQESSSGGTIQMGGKNDPVTDELRTPHKKWANSSSSRRRGNKGGNKNLHKGPKGPAPGGYADAPAPVAAAADPLEKFRAAMALLVEKDFKHIMVKKHAWEKIIPDMVPSTEKGEGSFDAASWVKVRTIMWDVIQNGATAAYKGGGADAAQKRWKPVAGEIVEVTFKVQDDGSIRVSDAWVVTKKE
jgi:hypothetical protein